MEQFPESPGGPACPGHSPSGAPDDGPVGREEGEEREEEVGAASRERVGYWACWDGGAPAPLPQVSASPAPQLPVSHHVPSNLCPMPALRCSFIPKVTNYSSLLQPGRLSSLHHQHPSEISCGRGGRDRRALGFKLNGGQTLLALRRLKSQQMKHVGDELLPSPRSTRRLTPSPDSLPASDKAPALLSRLQGLPVRGACPMAGAFPASLLLPRQLICAS